MKFSVDWQNDAINASLEEKVTTADWCWEISAENACTHISGNELHDVLTLPLYSIVNGLAHNWWTIFGGRADNSLFSLYRHRCGYFVPDVRMQYDGVFLETFANDFVYDNPKTRFLSIPSEFLSRDVAEKELSSFIEGVIKRLVDNGLANTNAELRWQRVSVSRQDPAECAFCEAAGALGEDPYQISEEAAQIIEQASVWFQGNAMLEFLAGINRGSFSTLANWMASVEARPVEKSLLSGVRSLSEDVVKKTPVRSQEKSWELGYRRARGLRSALGLRESHRFSNLPDLAVVVGASKSYEPAKLEAGNVHILRSDNVDGTSTHLHMGKYGGTSSNIFTFARGLGDVMCFPENQKSVVNNLKSAYRQAAGRAFAAEFLAPINEIRNMQDDGMDSESIAQEMGVSDTLIERQLENSARIESACAL